MLQFTSITERAHGPKLTIVCQLVWPIFNMLIFYFYFLQFVIKLIITINNIHIILIMYSFEEQ